MAIKVSNQERVARDDDEEEEEEEAEAEAEGVRKGREDRAALGLYGTRSDEEKTEKFTVFANDSSSPLDWPSRKPCLKEFWISSPLLSVVFSRDWQVSEAKLSPKWQWQRQRRWPSPSHLPRDSK